MRGTLRPIPRHCPGRLSPSPPQVGKSIEQSARSAGRGAIDPSRPHKRNGKAQLGISHAPSTRLGSERAYVTSARVSGSISATVRLEISARNRVDAANEAILQTREQRHSSGSARAYVYACHFAHRAVPEQRPYLTACR